MDLPKYVSCPISSPLVNLLSCSPASYFIQGIIILSNNGLNLIKNEYKLSKFDTELEKYLIK